jgi:uncharacterized protein (TIGR00299 family) protein
MSGRRFAIIDPSCGVSGDMLLGALVDLSPSSAWLSGLPARLGLDDVRVEIAPVERSNIRATKVDVRLGRATEGPGDVSERDLTGIREHSHHQEHHGDAPHGHQHGGGGTHHHSGHPHRHVAELLAMIARADLSDWVKQRASSAFQLLAEAEGRIHGVPAARVALHEVGALDALVDIVGAAAGFEHLGINDVYTRPVALGSGWVRTAHGILPVPTPATSMLIEGLTVAPDGPVVGEATTPTGATLLRVLTTPGTPPGRWRSVGCGWGAGGRDPEHYPNVLKIIIAEPVGSAADLDMVMLSTDIDDLSPEYLVALRDELVAAGAVDVVTWSTQMKKGRIGFRVEALTQVADVAAVTEAFFRHSTTAGVRAAQVSRRALPREHWSVEAPGGGQIRVKTIHGPDGPRVKPEYDDVIAAARRTGQPAHELSRSLQQQALGMARRGAAPSEGPDIDPVKESEE